MIGLRAQCQMRYSLNSLKGVYVGNYRVEHDRGYEVGYQEFRSRLKG